jgi:hypothetical protein
MKALNYILILVLLSSCAKFNVNRLTDDQKDFLLYKEGDSFSLLKNSIDTIHFKISDVQLSDTENCNETNQTGVVNFMRESLTSSKYLGYIRLESDNDYVVYFQGRIFAYNDTVFSTNYKSYTNTNDLIFIGDTILNNINYQNVYLIFEGYDSLFFSKEKGIIYVKFKDFNEKYTLIEKNNAT